jgi:hypothetical protein
MKDSSAAQVQLFSLADIAQGDHVEIAGFLNSNGRSSPRGWSVAMTPPRLFWPDR